MPGSDEADPRLGPRAPLGWFFPGALVATMMASAFQVFAIAIIASALIDDLGLSRTEIGIVGALNTAVGAVTAPATGRLTDRIGARRSVVTVLVISALCMAMMAAAPDVWWLALSAVVGGIPQGWGNPATNSLISTRVSPGRRGGITGVKQSGVTFGVFLSGATLPVLTSLWGWRGAVLSFAVLFAVLAVATMLTLGPDPVRPTDAATVAATASESRTPLDPFVWRLTLFALLMGTAGGAVGRFFPLFAEESLGFSLETAGALTAIGGLLGMAARILVGRLAERRITPTRLLSLLAMVGFAYCGLLAIVTPSTRELLYLSPPLSAVGIAAWNAVAMLAIIMFFSTTQAGRASGVVMLGFLGGMSIAGPIAGFVVDQLGDYRYVWAAATALTGLAAIVMWFDATGRTPA
ncbi:MAG: MFS transporter, partial [Ilumatobacter sp.]|nr:MFS transporter [Ilumatobacter sp.]